MKKDVIEIIRDRLMKNPDLNVEYLSVKKKITQQDMLRELLFEFLRELNLEDINKLTIRQAYNVVEGFMQRQGLLDE